MRPQSWRINFEYMLLSGYVQKSKRGADGFSGCNISKGCGKNERICKDIMLGSGSSVAMTASFSVNSTWLITCDCGEITVKRPCHHKAFLQSEPVCHNIWFWNRLWIICWNMEYVVRETLRPDDVKGQKELKKKKEKQKRPRCMERFWLQTQVTSC